MKKPVHKAKPTYNHKLARSSRRKGTGATWRMKVRERMNKGRDR